VRLPRRPWRVFNAGRGIIAIFDADRREIVGWPGFDSSQVPGHEARLAMAHHIVDCVNMVARDVGRGAHGANEGQQTGGCVQAEKGGDRWTPRYREDAEEVTPRASPPGDKGGPTECEGNDADPLPAVRIGQPRRTPTEEPGEAER